MTSSIGSNPSLSLLSLPNEALEPIFQYVVHDKGFSKLARTSLRCKEITYAILRSQWLQLSLPDAVLPQGLVDLLSEMRRIEQLHSGDFEDKPSNLFQKLANEFVNLKTKLPEGKLPLTPADLTVLQNEAMRVQLEESLCCIWERIVRTHSRLPVGMLPTLKTAAEIRSWLNHPNNAGIINRFTKLDLSSLKLRVLPPEIASFTKLQELHLCNNQLTILPDAIKTLTALRVLNLGNNKFTTLPDAIGTLTALQELYLHCNKLTTLPDAIRALTALQKLDLSTNQFTTLPDAIGALTALEMLNLDNNRLTTLPDAFKSLSRLKFLHLSENQLNALPDVIGTLTALQQLYLTKNQLTTLPDAFGSLTALQMLNLANNQLTTLPDAIRALTALQTLNLANNQLAIFPDAIGSLTALQTLDLANNQLTTLPDAFRALTALQILNLASNQLTTFPDVIRTFLTALQELNIDHNQFLITLPDTLKALTVLLSLYLIQENKSFKSYYSTFIMNNKYQFIAQKETEDYIKKIFSDISADSKNLIFEMVGNCAGAPKTDNSQWGEHHVFDDMNIFSLAVTEAISTKLKRLSQDKQNQVYDNVCKLREICDPTDLKWGENHALDNLPILAEAMIMLETQGKDEE